VLLTVITTGIVLLLLILGVQASLTHRSAVRTCKKLVDSVCRLTSCLLPACRYLLGRVCRNLAERYPPAALRHQIAPFVMDGSTPSALIHNSETLLQRPHPCLPIFKFDKISDRSLAHNTIDDHIRTSRSHHFWAGFVIRITRHFGHGEWSYIIPVVSNIQFLSLLRQI
jgi:hypothetical protein